MLAAAGRIARAVDVPVSADLEAGYQDEPGGVDATIEAAIEEGIAGVNLEDGAFGSEGEQLVPLEAHAEAVASALETAGRRGVQLFVNARTDAYWRGVAEGEALREEAATRLRAYADAGADCVFAPALADAADIRAIADAVRIPLNVLHVEGLPPLGELTALGVRRISFGADLYLAALGGLERTARALASGDLSILRGAERPAPATFEAVASL